MQPGRELISKAVWATCAVHHQHDSASAVFTVYWCTGDMAGDLYFFKGQAIAGVLPDRGYRAECRACQTALAVLSDAGGCLMRRMQPHSRASLPDCTTSCLWATGAARDRITYPAPGSDPHASCQIALEALHKEVTLPLGGGGGAAAAGGLGPAVLT